MMYRQGYRGPIIDNQLEQESIYYSFLLIYLWDVMFYQ